MGLKWKQKEHSAEDVSEMLAENSGTIFVFI